MPNSVKITIFADMRVLLYIILLLVITGCSYSGRCYSHELDQAQAMLHDDPVGALECLNGYDVSGFTDSATMARWALLYGEAMAANQLAAPTDTIINIAVNYYGAHNYDAEYRRACELKTVLSEGLCVNPLASALYVQKEKEFMLYKERARRTQLLAFGVILVLIAAGVIAWQHQRLKVKETQTSVLMAEASALKEHLIRRQSECSSLASKLSDSLANRFSIIDELCQTYYESQGSKTEKKAIVEKVKSQIGALKADEGIFSEMERCHSDMLRQFQQQFPALKPEEYRLMVYLAAGLSNRTIALLIGESIEVVYKRKSRLKAKIVTSGVDGKADFLSVFH